MFGNWTLKSEASTKGRKAHKGIRAAQALETIERGSQSAHAAIITFNLYSVRD